ncbi:MAG TPA: hypothetical protein PKN52_05565, partial [Trueperaceae bacterium]|nr:hypothetical protein [Trueperaceae bacterium]
MLFRRQRAPAPDTVTASAQEALARGQYDVAFAMLESAVRRGTNRSGANRAEQGQTWLQLAAVYALYGDEGLENGQPALRSAVAAEPKLASHPLYRALFWEFAAYRGAPLADVKRGLREVPEHAVDGMPGSFDVVAAYHAAAALFAVDAAKSARRRLRAVPEGGLPAYLEWRRWSLLGQCCETLGEWEEAADAFAMAVDQAPDQERHGALGDPHRLPDRQSHLIQGRARAQLDLALGIHPGDQGAFGLGANGDRVGAGGLSLHLAVPAVEGLKDH